MRDRCPDAAPPELAGLQVTVPQWRGSGLAARTGTLSYKLGSEDVGDCRNGGAAGWLPGH